VEANETPTPRRKSKSQKAFYLVGTLLLLVFAGFSYSKFTTTLTPYVTYHDARSTQRTVQVAGGLVKGSSSYDSVDHFLRFTLVDAEKPDQLMPVRYQGIKPANFEDAISIVAIGRFDATRGEFVANDLLVKCPSKYQGIEEYESKSYSAEKTS
jgi:cytochrome c-type biogenesis protein CcmE